ncbi:MAG: hypothetical protein QNJ45_27150 [Ardenticatenaceae bacterium]|nr:hypothetical protein [Ardenticatenaceae bacterium]
MTIIEHLTVSQMEAGLPHIQAAPQDNGTLEMIVIRPGVDEREVLETAELSTELGVVGDNWSQRQSSRMPGKDKPHPDMQINMTNARAIDLIAGDRSRWALAGDQLYVDLDLSEANMPPGTRLAIGSAVLEVTAQPHNGCKKFAQRYGVDAVKFFNSPQGKELHLRGINLKVVQAGTIRRGDLIKKINS